MSSTGGEFQHEMAVLQDQYSYLADALVPEDILPEMFARKLMTKTQKQKAESHSEKYRKNEVLLDSLLARREVGAFQKFCDALSATTGQEYIAERLKECKLTGNKVMYFLKIALCCFVILLFLLYTGLAQTCKDPSGKMKDDRKKPGNFL